MDVTVSAAASSTSKARRASLRWAVVGAVVVLGAAVVAVTRLGPTASVTSRESATGTPAPAPAPAPAQGGATDLPSVGPLFAKKLDSAARVLSIQWVDGVGGIASTVRRKTDRLDLEDIHYSPTTGQFDVTRQQSFPFGGLDEGMRLADVDWSFVERSQREATAKFAATFGTQGQVVDAGIIALSGHPYELKIGVRAGPRTEGYVYEMPGRAPSPRPAEDRGGSRNKRPLDVRF